MSDVPFPVSSDEPLELPDIPAAPDEPRVPAAPIRSRFLFVDVAAQRAKQLRRGALPRVEAPDTHKLERVAMREVSAGCVDWTLPSYKGAPLEATS
jgi:DNA-directed RNA polymerase omega subunit